MSSRYVLGIGSLCAVSTVLSACAEDCTDIVHPAVRVVVSDSVTGEQVFAGVTVVVRDGAFTDTLDGPTGTVGSSVAFQGAWGRPGRYSIEVRQTGYRNWLGGPVVAGSVRCGGVGTSEIAARLQPLP